MGSGERGAERGGGGVLGGGSWGGIRPYFFCRFHVVVSVTAHHLFFRLFSFQPIYSSLRYFPSPSYSGSHKACSPPPSPQRLFRAL